MKRIAISAEKVCDLELNELKELGVEVISQDALDGSCLSIANSTKDAINEFDFYSYFDALLDSAKEIVHFSASSALNPMYTMAELGREKLDADKQQRVHIIDSKNGSLALGLMLKIASEMAQNGATVSEIKTMANEMQNHISAVYASEELNSLPITKKMNKFTAFWSKLFKQKSIFKLNKKGKLQAFASAKNKQTAIKKLAKYLLKKYDNYADLPIYIMYSNCQEDANMLKSEIAKYIDVKVNLKPIKTKFIAPRRAIALFFTSSSK